jgi:hypothetical protein
MYMCTGKVLSEFEEKIWPFKCIFSTDNLVSSANKTYLLKRHVTEILLKVI